MLSTAPPALTSAPIVPARALAPSLVATARGASVSVPPRADIRVATAPAGPLAPTLLAPPSTARPPVPALDPDSDRVLVIRAASGDSDAFAVIVRRYTGLLRATARRTLGSSADVDDVVQDTFLAAWSHADSVIDGDTIAGWLVTTVRRRSYDRLRSSATRTRAELDDELPASPHDAPDAQASRASLAADARRVLATMPSPQRRCWELRVEGASYLEIGAELGLPLTTVRGMLARARATLASELAHWR
ncbi:sigma-70 family RNA polymerase sigma factor [Rathayibacter sp. VKM Ac-2803]|uniref:RNA polymerase sigma factor n=1 Tax=Rathayibacter sp. VKM Ac-2803 TaxID=2609256 RepID=UPI00135BD1AD|nr:RNA polymerase sigma factor [Rathayibacter sp. VKM Ac-2803]MWV48938.1 sigma-70 family RNA polymerase sigma factor [Rathayibacter sp. VKM Ac-2803]